MNKKICICFFLLTMCCAGFAQKVLKRGITISQSVRIKKANYFLPAFDSLNRSLVVIRGDNIVVDFNGAVLNGSSGKKNPDGFMGVAILITGGKNITIKNLTAKGYKIALLARNVAGLTIENCDFSYNYRPRLNSSQEKEDLSDWMSYHRNENDEWLRYGAAIYLRGCKGATIAGNKVTGGQNALMLTECSGSTIYNNDFSFNSGIGIGFYRSSYNQVVHNRVNFNVRGYSHGIYNRGQDSAGFLVYEQSSHNLFYKNSATHSGDGFFLWAGQSTIDTGEGGCNDNQVLFNDFSFAPTNGIEVTFSRNRIANNRIFECEHGIWGGYSYASVIADNQFRNNRIAIAIEHGQQNEITGNTFLGNQEAIKLWARPQQPPDWAYARLRDTRSRKYTIGANNFSRNKLVFNLQRTDSLHIFDNTYTDNEERYRIDTTVRHIDSFPVLLFDSAATDFAFPKGMDAFKGNGRLAGRKNIRMTPWGPYDFRYPVLWHTNPLDTTGKMDFEVLGPKGKWKIVSAKGVGEPTIGTDSFPSKLSFSREAGEKQDIQIVAEYRGPAFTDAFGNRVPANKPFRFTFTKFFQPIPFVVKWYSLDTSIQSFDSITSTLRGTEPVKTDTVTQLDYAWWGGLKTPDSTYSRFLTVSEGFARLDTALYEISVTWDDAVRVFVDEKLVLDRWQAGLNTFDEAPNKRIALRLGGRHKFRLEHAELGGFAAIRLVLRKL